MVDGSVLLQKFQTTTKHSNLNAKGDLKCILPPENFNKTSRIFILSPVVGKWGFWDIDLGTFRKLGQDFLNLNFAEKPKIKEKNLYFLQKIKIKNLSFFKKKLGQEIKIRKNPDKTAKIRKSFLGH